MKMWEIWLPGDSKPYQTGMALSIRLPWVPVTVVTSASRKTAQQPRQGCRWQDIPHLGDDLCVQPPLFST